MLLLVQVESELADSFRARAGDENTLVSKSILSLHKTAMLERIKIFSPVFGDFKTILRRRTEGEFSLSRFSKVRI